MFSNSSLFPCAPLSVLAPSAAPRCQFDLDRQETMAGNESPVFGTGPDLGRQHFPDPVWATDTGPHGFFQAPAAYRLAIANDRARALAPLEGPMVPLDPPSPDVTYDRRREKAERMELKRVCYMRPQEPSAAPISRCVLECILKESATAMADFSEDFKRLILQSCLHYGMETFYQSWNCGYESAEGGLGEFNPKKRVPACRDPNQIGFFSIKGHWWENQRWTVSNRTSMRQRVNTRQTLSASSAVYCAVSSTST